ncbi:hypothetical protein [Paraburkholderia phenazinium]|jgi:hypothetical protein|uniref:Uncharacterized protein n=1 Tax=Paraburkholderia phenazinium TaxID=60549 RepID=A0A1N6EFY8_9BURK|nr:hypothetical protein [Paraburkholderia phenazinium]SIN81943.1 hypothetical protein SAMN05444168_0591 [Paraburkholderia phenazinium]
MTATTYNSTFHQTRAITWPFSSSTDTTLEGFPVIEIERQPSSAYSMPMGTVIGGSIFSMKIDITSSATGAEIIVETRPADRAREKLLLERQILTFLNLDGLEDEEAKNLLTQAVPEALVFIGELPQEIPLPKATIAFDGIVTLEWQDGLKRAAAMFEGDDDYGYAYFRNGTYVPGKSVAVAGNGIPEDLTSYLTA